MNEFLEIVKKRLKLTLNYLFDQNLIEKAFQNRYDAIYYDKEINGNSELFIDILENEVIKLLEKERTKDETLILNRIKLFYLEKVINHREMMLGSILFKTPYFEKFFNDKESQTKIKRVYGEVKKDVGSYYQRFMKNESLSDIEQVTLFKYLIANLDTKNSKLINIFDNIIKKILELNGDVHTTGKEFLIKFIVYKKCQQLGFKVSLVYFGNRDLITNEEINCKGRLYYNGIMIINDNFLKKNCSEINGNSGITQMTILIRVVFHELQHYKQRIELKNGELTFSAWNMVKAILLRESLSNSSFNEYTANYMMVEVEREAEYIAWIETIKFLSRYSSNFTNQIELINSIQKKNMLIEKYAHKKKPNQEGKIISFATERYNIVNLSEIIKSCPNLLKKYKILTLFFDENGLKRTDVLIKEFAKYLNSDLNDKSEFIKIYSEIFSYCFVETKLIEFERYIKDFRIEEQCAMFYIFFYLLERECSSFNDMIEVFYDNKEFYYKLFLKLGVFRIKKIKKYYSFLTKWNDYLINVFLQNNELLKSGGGIVLDFPCDILSVKNEIVTILKRVMAFPSEFETKPFIDVLSKTPGFMDFDSEVNKTLKEDTNGNSRK